VKQDVWAQWLLERRFGGDLARRDRTMARLLPIRDRILDRADLRPGDVLLDVGTGDGLIAFGALERLGPSGKVIMSDVSEELLAVCREAVARTEVGHRCNFLKAGAEDLSEVAEGSVDVVTTRSVLIYVTRKADALAEFYRVLRPGGRMSLFEPINRYFGLRPPPTAWWGFDVTSVRELAVRVREVYDRAQPPDTSPLMDFDDRDLVRMAADVGFNPVSLTLKVDMSRGEHWSSSWEAFLHTAPNPCLPTFAEATSQALSEEGARRLFAHLRPQLEEGRAVTSSAVAFLTGRKPEQDSEPHAEAPV
jgi:ubiquinone/menaquinone biosynthesis C-methylase UbiE